MGISTVRSHRVGGTHLVSSLALAIPLKAARCEAVQECLPELTPQSKCLDIGTGTGGVISRIAREGRWTFVDEKEDRLEVAKTALTGEFVSGDALDYLSQTKGWNLITSIDSIIYFEQPEQGLKVIYESLGPDGILIATAGTLSGGVLNRIRGLLGIHQATARIWNPDANEMAKTLSRVGFKVNHFEYYCGPLTYAVQTALDFIVMKRGTGGDRLTAKLHPTTRNDLFKIVGCAVISAINLLCRRLESFIPGSPRHCYVVVAQKPRL